MLELLFSVGIADCDVQTFCAGGKGGQHQNKTQSGVRVVHRQSGAVGECREERSQHTNKRRAFVRMAQSAKFEAWRRIETARRLGQVVDVNALVEKAMAEQNLLVETRCEGRWIT